MHVRTVLIFLPLLVLSSPIRRQNNLQPFTGALGGEAATPVEDSGNADRPFQVGQDTFVNIGAAWQRSCDQQFNRYVVTCLVCEWPALIEDSCANLANGGDKTLSVGDCQDQKGTCLAHGTILL